jgi:hypothetical protein
VAEENLKDFAVNWAIFGLLLTCLISFTIFFMYENNPIGLNDGSEDILDSTDTNMRKSLQEIEGDTNELLNITAQTNPEVSFLGSIDSVSTAYEIAGSAKSQWANTKTLIKWIFSGEVGEILLGVFGGLIGFLSIYFITKWIRIGS